MPVVGGRGALEGRFELKCAASPYWHGRLVEAAAQGGGHTAAATAALHLRLLF